MHFTAHKSNCRRASRPRLNRDLHAIDAAPARRLAVRFSDRATRARCRRTRLTGQVAHRHFNKAHAALLLASASALTGSGKKPFPKLRPLKSALAAKPDLFGINEEDALLRSKREGQDSFRGAFEKAALLQADVFGAFRRRYRLPSL